MFRINIFFQRLALLTVMMMFLAACQPGPSQGLADDSALLVTVSILPQGYFVERIAGDLVAVNVMVGPGEDPHTYEPKPEQMRALSNSQLFFTIGTEYEDAWLPRLSEVNPELTFVDSAAGIQRIPLTDPHHHDDDDDHYEDEADHGDETGLDPHVWLSPNNGKIIARNIFTALAAASPENAAVFTANYEALVADIDALDSQISGTLSGVTQRNFMVYHPAWGYFAAEYDLTQIPIQSGGTDPSPSELAALIDQALDESISVIFVQPTFSTANAQAIAAEIGGEVVVADPLAHNWLENLELVADAFAAALGQ